MGGPAGLTARLRALGDKVTRLDRMEPQLNEALPGDRRDTTTPRAMVGTTEALLFSDDLSEPSRLQLAAWMKQDRVAGALIRSSIPGDWTIGDKSGAGGNGSRAIVAVMHTPTGSPWLAAIYITGNQAVLESRNRAIARIGAAMVEAITEAENGRQ